MKQKIQKIKHLYFVYPHHNTMLLDDLSVAGTEELIDRRTQAVKLSKSSTFKLLVGIKVSALVFIPLLLLNYLASFLPFKFGDDNGGWGFLDVIFAVFIAWDMLKTYQAITNYYPNLVIGEIEKRAGENG